MNNKDVERLIELGFTGVEARVYLCLIQSPEGQSFEEVAHNCELEINTVQEALEKMVEKGIITIRANRFEAKSPQKAFSELASAREKKLEEEIERIQKNSQHLSESLEPIYQERKLGISPEELLEPLMDLSAMELRTVRLIGEAESEVKIFAETFGWYEKVREAIYGALERGAKFRIIMTAPDEQSSSRGKELLGLGVKVRILPSEWYPIRGTLADARELVFVIWSTSKKTERPVYFRPHYTRNQGLVKIFGDAFEEKWREAKPL